MVDSTIRDTVEELLGIDPVVAGRDELDRVVSLSAKVRAWTDAVDIAVARRAKQLSPATGGGHTPGADAADVLSNHGRRSTRESKAANERSAVCDRMPGFEDALTHGEVTAEHVDAIARATRGLDAAGKSIVDGFAADLLSAAKNTGVAAFERDVRDLVQLVTRPDDGSSELDAQRRRSRLSRWIDKETGMWKLFAEVDPETGARLWGALDQRLDSIKQREGNAEVPIERLVVDALVELVTTGGHGERRGAEIVVHIDRSSLLHGTHADSLCELADGTPLPVSTVRRLCCDATIVPLLIGPDGTPVDAGREVRTANRKQRRMLRAMYRTCGHPHCTVPFSQCDIHHVIPWEQLGLTDLANLLPLCSRHHHLVHEGGWGLTMSPDRCITLRRPDETTHFVGSTVDRPNGIIPMVDDQGDRMHPGRAPAAGSGGCGDPPGNVRQPAA